MLGVSIFAFAKSYNNERGKQKKTKKVLLSDLNYYNEGIVHRAISPTDESLIHFLDTENEIGYRAAIQSDLHLSCLNVFSPPILSFRLKISN